MDLNIPGEVTVVSYPVKAFVAGAFALALALALGSGPAFAQAKCNDVLVQATATTVDSYQKAVAYINTIHSDQDFQQSKAFLSSAAFLVYDIPVDASADYKTFDNSRQVFDQNIKYNEDINSYQWTQTAFFTPEQITAWSQCINGGGLWARVEQWTDSEVTLVIEYRYPQNGPQGAPYAVTISSPTGGSYKTATKKPHVQHDGTLTWSHLTTSFDVAVTYARTPSSPFRVSIQAIGDPVVISLPYHAAPAQCEIDLAASGTQQEGAQIPLNCNLPKGAHYNIFITGTVRGDNPDPANIAAGINWWLEMDLLLAGSANPLAIYPTPAGFLHLSQNGTAFTLERVNDPALVVDPHSGQVAAVLYVPHAHSGMVGGGVNIPVGTSFSFVAPSKALITAY